jgi:AcrR family transcriptional regulator
VRWRRRKDARPEEILSAALGIFAEKGFAATRMDDIAARAGVTKGTIYLYFKSKDAVFEALLQQTLGAKITGLSGLIHAHEGSSADLLADILRNIGQFLATSELAVLPKIVIAEAGNFPELARFYRNQVIERGLALLGGIVEAGIARGEFKRMPVEHAVRLCVAPLLLSMIWRSVFGRFDTTPYDYAGLIDLHLRTLIQGFAPQRENAA